MAKESVILRGWQPQSTNVLMRLHWARRAKLLRADKAVIARVVAKKQLSKATGRRRLSVELLLGPRQRGMDADNFNKSLCDSLVAAGALVDDRKEYLEIGPVTYTRDAYKGIVITLENLPPYEGPG